MGIYYHKMKDKPISKLPELVVSMLYLLLILTHSPHFVTGQKQEGGAAAGPPVSLSDFLALRSIKSSLIDPRGSLRSWKIENRNETCSGNWVGIRCTNGRVVAIHLPFKSLEGSLSSQIGLLKGLRSLSLHDNLIAGAIPYTLGSLPNLRGVYLFNNQLSGSIPSSLGNGPGQQLVSVDLSNNLLSGVVPGSFLASSPRIYRLNLSYNSLSGPIPDSLGELSNLRVLDLSRNNFSGPIPTTFNNLSNLTYLDVSNNQLSGKVPAGLSKRFNSSSFAGNLQLCGFNGSTTPCPSSPPPMEAKSPSPLVLSEKHHRKKLGIKDIILILMGSLIAILLVVSCVLVYCLVRKREGGAAMATSGKRGEAVAGASRDDDGGGKLVLFDGALEFTADDLLSATAETMGKSPFGTMYKATLQDGTTQVVVKRLREKLTKSPEEFEQESSALGRVRHANVLPLRAYYLGPKGEKLLVFDYLAKGTLSSFLHARAPETIVDWPTRLRITLGISHGLNHLHTQHNIIHGNLTSSDIYLDDQNTPKLANYGLHRLMLSDTSTQHSTTTTTTTAVGYRAPELSSMKNPTTKTDIYSLGVTILELLTGKSPGEEGSDLPQWVASMVKDERTNEVFDLELMMKRRDDGGEDNAGDQLLNVLKLALHLVDPSPDARPDACHVLQQLEEMMMIQ